MKVWRRRLLCLGFVLALAGPAQAQRNPRPPAPPAPFIPGPWWRDFQKQLNLTPDQSARIEAVFQTAMVDQRPRLDAMRMAEAELSRLIEADADEQMIAKQSEKVESLRMSLNKHRTLMLVHMRQVLSPDQRLKLRTIREEWDRHEPAPPPRDGDRTRRDNK